MKLLAMMALGLAVGRNDIEQIESICSKALALDQRDVMALMVLADTYWRNKQFEKAMPPALQALKLDPKDFYAIRIVAGVHAERGEHESAYQHAKRLLAAGPPDFPPTKAASRILAPFSWLPKIRRLRERVARDEKENETSYAEWIQWAKGYVSWYESSSSSAT
jgi:cytochrome c-type biogenesis protein CcmH/NrfG